MTKIYITRVAHFTIRRLYKLTAIHYTNVERQLERQAMDALSSVSDNVSAVIQGVLV